MFSALRPTLAGRAAALLCLLALLSACASTSAGKKASGEAAALDMPDAEKVRELAAAPAPDVDVSEMAGPQPAERWELVAPLPDTMGHVPRQITESWERGFASLVDGLKDTHRSEASACVARQKSHYVLANDRWPDSELDTFIPARCGWICGYFRGNVSHL